MVVFGRNGSSIKSLTIPVMPACHSKAADRELVVFCSFSIVYFFFLGFSFLAVVFFSPKTDLAFIELTTFLPVLASNSNLATLATLPPYFAIFLLSLKFSGFTACEISLVDASASIFKISSV